MESILKIQTVAKGRGGPGAGPRGSASFPRHTKGCQGCCRSCPASPRGRLHKSRTRAKVSDFFPPFSKFSSLLAGLPARACGRIFPLHCARLARSHFLANDALRLPGVERHRRTVHRCRFETAWPAVAFRGRSVPSPPVPLVRGVLLTPLVAKSPGPARCCRVQAGILISQRGEEGPPRRYRISRARCRVSRARRQEGPGRGLPCRSSIWCCILSRGAGEGRRIVEG